MEKEERDRIQTIWKFVENNYPDYDHSDEIAWNGDLHKLVNKEYEKGDCADRTLQNLYGGDINHPQIFIDYHAGLIKIYEESILNYHKKNSV